MGQGQAKQIATNQGIAQAPGQQRKYSMMVNRACFNENFSKLEGDQVAFYDLAKSAILCSDRYAQVKAKIEQKQYEQAVKVEEKLLTMTPEQKAQMEERLATLTPEQKMEYEKKMAQMQQLLANPPITITSEQKAEYEQKLALLKQASSTEMETTNTSITQVMEDNNTTVVMLTNAENVEGFGNMSNYYNMNMILLLVIVVIIIVLAMSYKKN